MKFLKVKCNPTNKKHGLMYEINFEFQNFLVNIKQEIIHSDEEDVGHRMETSIGQLDMKVNVVCSHFKHECQGTQ